MSNPSDPTTSWGDPSSQPAPLAYASWGRRVGAFLVDVLATVPAYLVIGIGMGIALAGAESATDPVTGRTTVEGGNAAGWAVAGIGYVLIFVIVLWNLVLRQGRTGWSVGKQALGIRLVRQDSGRPMGAGLCFVRQVVHVVDGLPCYLGYLWPLWDAQRQTFADKIMSTVVVHERKS